MAYITGFSEVADTSSSSLELTLPASVQNDVTFLFATYYGAATITSVTGDNGGTWTAVESTTGIYTYRCVQGATPDTKVTVATSGTHRCIHGAINVRGADTTTPVDVSANTSVTDRYAECPTVTTTADDALILMCVNSRVQACRPPEGCDIHTVVQDTFYHSMTTCSTSHISNGATGAYRYHFPINTTYTNYGVTIAVKDDGSTGVKGYLDLTSAPFEYIHYMSRYDGELGDDTIYDPTDAGNENISSLSNGSYTTSSLTYKTPSAYLEDGLEVGYVSRHMSYTGAAEDTTIQASTITETYGSQDDYDLSSEILIVGSKNSDPRVALDAEIGGAIGLTDGTNWRMWQLGAKDSVPSVTSGLFPTIIDVADSTYDMDSGGNLDEANVSGIILAGQTRAAYVYYYFSPVMKMGTMKAQGGSSTVPASFETFYDCAKRGMINTVLSQGGLAASQYFVCQHTQCGGTEPVYWDSSNQAAEWPAAYDASAKKRNFQIGAGTLTHTIGGITGSTVIYDSTTLNLGNYHNLIFDSSVAISSDGLVVLNADVELKNNGSTALSGVTFSGCKEITYTTLVDLSGGNTISNCVDTTAITVTSETDFDKLANCTFTNNNRAITITGNQTGTWSDPNLTVSGNTYDLEYSGTTNFTIESANSLTVNNTSSGVLTVSTPTISLTVNSNIASSDIKIFDTNTQTIEASATGTTASTTNAGTYDITVQKAGYLPQRQTGVVLGASNVTVNFTLIEDPIYNSSHGLTFTTDYSYNASTRVLTIVANQEGRDLYSALIDDFISETSLRNCPFPLTAVGPDRIDFNAVGYYNTATTVGATIDSGDIQYWKGAGMEWEHDTTGNPTKKYYSIKSANALQTGSVVGYTQVNNGTAAACTLVSDKVNEVIQFFEDTNGDGTADYEYNSHLLFKGFKTGYYQARWDVINDSGITTLEPYEYTINLLQDAISGTTGDQTITITTLTDHTSSPLSVGGKSFDYELVDPATSTAENLLAQYNYDVFTAVNADITGSLYTSYNAFDLPDLIVEVGSNYETERGYFEGDGAVTDLSGVYLSRSSSDHPDIARFQSNDGTYYTPATVAQISAPNLTSGRVQIYNNTGAAASSWAATTAYNEGDYVLRTTGKGTELGDGVFFVCTTAGTSGGSEPTWDVTLDGNTTADGTVTWTVRPVEFDNTTTAGAYSNSWTDGEHFASGDVIRLRWCDSDEDEIETTGSATAASTTTFLDTPVDDDVYDSYGIDGSTVTEFTADYPNIEVDITDPDNVFYIDRFYAWYKYNLTTEGGIRNFFGGVTAVNTSNITINNSVVDIFFDNTKAASARQGDNIVIQRADGAYPQVTTTSGGGGLGFYYTGIGYSTSSGSGLDTTERNKLLGLYDFNPTTNTTENGETYEETVRLVRAATVGKSTVSGTTVTFRDAADSKDRITATTDSDGQRTSVTTDAS